MKNLKAKLSLLLALVLSFALFIGFQSVSAENAVEDAKTNVLTYEGMLARTVGDSGIRSLFRIDRAALKTLEENGYTVEIGALMSAAHNNKAEDLAVVADAEKGYVPTTEKTLSIVVYSSSGADYATNKYISANAAEYTFAYTTIFSEEYETAEYYSLEFCYRAFLALTKDGVTTIEYVDTDGEAFDTSVSLYDVVKYFVSGGYTGEKAEEYANLEKFHTIVDAVESVTPEVPNVYEYFPKDDAGAAGKLLTDDETLLVNQTAHTFTVNVARAGIYGVKMKYNSKNQQVPYILLKNETYPNAKTTEGRIKANLLTYETTPTDFVVPAADKAGAYQPDASVATMNTYYFGGDFLYIYLGAGENTLSLSASNYGSSSGILEFGLYAMQFTMLEELSLDDQVKYSAFTRGDTSGAYNGGLFPHSTTSTLLKEISTTLTLKAGAYRISGLVQLGPQAQMTIELLSGDTVIGTVSYKHTQSSQQVFAPGTSTSFRYIAFDEEITVAEKGEYTVRISHSGSFYTALSELYFTRVSAIPEPLSAPEVTVLDGVASWDAIPDATAYAYKINGGEIQTTTATSVTLANVGDTITVMAIGDGIESLDSAWSEVKTYHVTVFNIVLNNADTYTAVGLTKETEGDYAGRYLLTAAGSTNYIEFKITPSVSGLYAVSYDAATGSGSAARSYHKNMTNKGDGWSTHATSAQLPANATITLDKTAAYQYLYAGEENTIRVYLEKDRAKIYFSQIRLSLYWEDTSVAKQIITENVVSDIVGSTEANCVGNTGISKLALLATGALVVRTEGTQTASAKIALPKVEEAGAYKVYVVGITYIVNGASADLAFSTGDTFTFNNALKNAFNLDRHAGEATLYEIGEIMMLADTDYSVTLSLSTRMWAVIHAIYLEKTGEYEGEKVALGAPSVTVSSTGVASWEAVPNATGYEYTIDGGTPVKTTDTSVTLTEGQSIAVKALGEGAYADSEYSAAVTYVVGAATEWEFDLSNAASYAKGGSVSYADGYLYMPAGAANYIEFTVNAAKAGFYNISFIGKAPNRARIYHKNTTDKGDGWASHATSAQFAKGSVQSEYTYATNQYLYEGKNTIKIYVYDGEYSASMIRIALSFADPADVTHVVLSETNTETTKVNTQGGIGTNQFSSGATWVRGTDKVKFTLPKITEHGQYELYLLGSIYSSVDTTFTLSDGRTFTYKPASLPNHYVEGNLYKLATLNLLADSYTLEATITGAWAGFHRFVLVKVGEYPEALTVSSFSADPAAKTLSANGVFASPNYNRVVLAAYDRSGNVLAEKTLDKTAIALNFTDFTLTLTDTQSANFSYARVYAVDGEGNEGALTPYEFVSADTLTASAYTANKETGVFSAKVDFHSYSGKYATLALYNAAGAIVATKSVEKTGYSLVGETMSITLSSAEAATVAAMQVFVTNEKNGTTASDGYTSFRYTFAGDLRLIFVSDLHYNVKQGGSGKNNNLHGLDADARAQHFVDAILKENAVDPIDAVFLLGDLASAEDWYKYFDPEHAAYKRNTNAAKDYNGDGKVDLDDYYVSDYEAIRILNEEYLSQLEDAHIPVYCVPGNHDTIRNEYWERIFGYKAKFGYTETEYIVKFEEQKTAVIMLNTFDEEKGSMTMSRNNDGKSYLANSQQTLAYTPVDEARLFDFLAELRREGYESVYIASHYFQGSDAALVKAASEYSDIIKAFIYGDVHNDNVGTIGGIPSFVDGHYSQSLIEQVGSLGERLFDLERMPFSWILVEQKGSVATVDYYKEEALYLGRDNYEFLSQYLTLTKENVTKKGENMIILTPYTSVKSADGKYTDTIVADYYSYAIRTDISAEMQATAARIVDQIETYSMDMFLLNYGDTDTIPANYKTTTVTYYKTDAGKFSISGNGSGWCYYYLGSMPRYESFFQEKMCYKSYELFNGAVKKTYEDTAETTRTPIYTQPE